MKNISKFDYCYGCSVCASACPKKAISMHIDTEGFYKPIVDDSICINCGICLNVCAFNSLEVIQDKDFPIRNYAVWSKDEDVRNRCTSGGVGFEVGRFLLNKGYKAIVCKYNSETHHAEHYMAKTEKELIASIGSKYIQSDAIYGFKQIKKGEKFFITGSPCQIDSIRRLVRKRKMEDDVILLDFFCHGVPSYLMWFQYLKELENKIGTVNNIVWRDKETGWHDSWVMKIPGRYTSWFTKGDSFYRMFLGDRCLGRQCYHNCKYKYNHSAADIRIGDLWGRKYSSDEKGVNGVVCFTERGLNLLKEMHPILHIEDSTLEIVAESQMKKCAHKPISYKYTMNSLKKGIPLKEILQKASYIELVERIPNKLTYYITRLPSKTLEVLGLKEKPQK